MSKQPPPAPTASTVGPCHIVVQIVGRRGTDSVPSTIAPLDHPYLFFDGCAPLVLKLAVTYKRESSKKSPFHPSCYDKDSGKGFPETSGRKKSGC